MSTASGLLQSERSPSGSFCSEKGFRNKGTVNTGVGVEKHHGFLEDHKSLKSKGSREREMRGKEKQKEVGKEAESSSKQPLAKVSSHR